MFLMRVQSQLPSMRVILITALADSRQPGKRRLETRDEIARIREGKVASILDVRVQSALLGRSLLPEQPLELRTGLSTEGELQRLQIVEDHLSFAPLNAIAEDALAADLGAVGATLEQGIGLRNQLFREKQCESRDAGVVPANWTEFTTNPNAPPLGALRAMLATRSKPKLSPKLANALVEAIIEANWAGKLSTNVSSAAMNTLDPWTYLPPPTLTAPAAAAARVPSL
jgi:hypothetical protein